MNERKSALLSAIINEHIKSGQAVASKVVVDKYKFPLSTATIRNEMAELESDGFITQPHTSAGRIPTEKGWKYYIENFIKDVPIPNEIKNRLDISIGQTGLSAEMMIKNLAKGLAEISQEAIFVGLGRDNFFYTGLANLFRQPEFQKLDLVCHLSEVVDHLDVVINLMFDEVIDSDQEKFMVGRENPFDHECSAIVGRYKAPGQPPGIFGILGPMRMNYAQNLSLIKYVKEIFANNFKQANG